MGNARRWPTGTDGGGGPLLQSPCGRSANAMPALRAYSHSTWRRLWLAWTAGGAGAVVAIALMHAHVNAPWVNTSEHGRVGVHPALPAKLSWPHALHVGDDVRVCVAASASVVAVLRARDGRPPCAHLGARGARPPHPPCPQGVPTCF